MRSEKILNFKLNLNSISFDAANNFQLAFDEYLLRGKYGGKIQALLRCTQHFIMMIYAMRFTACYRGENEMRKKDV